MKLKTIMPGRLSYTISALVLLLFLSSCIASPVESSPGPPLDSPAASPPDTFTVERGTVMQRSTIAGILRVHSVPVSFDVSNARVGEVFVVNGSLVYEGQLLARLDTEGIYAAIEAYTEHLYRLRLINSLEIERDRIAIVVMYIEYTNLTEYAMQNQDESALERSQHLQRDIRWRELLNAQSLETRNIVMANIEQRIGELVDSLAELELFAPFYGVVTNVLVGIGSFVAPGDYAFMIAPPGQDVFVEYVGQSWEPHVFGHVLRFGAYIDGIRYELEPIELTVDELRYYAARSYRLLGQFERPMRFSVVPGEHPTPRPGQLVMIVPYFEYLEDVLRIPQNAVHFGHYGAYVIALVDGMPRQTFVQVTITLTFIAIHEGLSEGDVVFVRP